MSCTCANGGNCISISPFQICECPSGFMGARCQDFIFDFTHKDHDSDLDKVAVGLGVLFMVFLSALICYLICRKLHSIRRKKIKELKNQYRRQSKATIEGVTFGAGYESESSEKVTWNEFASKLSVVNEEVLPEKSVNAMLTSTANDTDNDILSSTCDFESVKSTEETKTTNVTFCVTKH